MATVSTPRTARPGQTDAATPATTALARAGVSYTVHRYEHDPAARSYGLEAAEALGVPADRVFKTLLVGSLDLKALASARGGKRAGMAASSAAERATGYVVGGISPLGQRKRLPTVVDSTAVEFPTIFVSAGRRGMDVELPPDQLVRLTDATTARIGRPG